MFNKVTTFTLDKKNVEVLDGELLKTAALKLPDGIKYDPDYFYMKVRAVSAGEYWGCNKNFDYFPEEELKKSYKTFLTAHAFKNHENKAVENAIGDVLTAEWNDTMKGVDLLIRIDRRIAPTIVRGFEKGFMTDVSMGCRIDYSICSICGNKARTKFEYCDHIRAMRGKVYDDGRKVYEININPKFHDISAVLNGAERVAKVTGLLIVGDKVAFEVPEKLEKAASFQEELTNLYELNKIEKAAHYNIKDDIEIFERKQPKMNKVAYVDKVAEIKKEIQGRVLDLAKGEWLNERSENIDSLIRTVKLLYTKYWDRSKCKQIASNIRLIADRKNVPLEVAFHQFLQVLNFAGIELSPLEFHDIYHELIDVDTPDIRSIPLSEIEDANKFMTNIEEIIDNHTVNNLSIPTLFKSIDYIEPNIRSVLPKIEGDNHIDKLKAIIIKTSRPIPIIKDDIMHSEIMDKIVSPLMPERSAHRRFLINRLINIANGEIEPNPANQIHFAPTKMIISTRLIKDQNLLPFILSGLMHSVYENERVSMFNDGTLLYGMHKFASHIEGDTMDNILNEYITEKTAGVRTKSIFIGIPLTYSYSALQRSRMNNGENISSFNRYVAENPGNAAMLQTILIPLVTKNVSKVSKPVLEKTTKTINKLFKKAKEQENNFEKLAEYDKILYNKDMFEDVSIENELLKNGYSKNQITALKYASVLNCMGRQDLSDDILIKHSLDENDLLEYLKTAKDCIRIEIEKNASVIDVGKIAFGNMLTYKPEGLVSASIPGAVIDGIILTKLSKFLKTKNDNQTKNNLR
ncbi:MAG: hypothetical protein N2749_00670 [Clostridia bacterium]|nr:hypothetical protein [Clostridia bacterium]